VHPGVVLGVVSGVVASGVVASGKVVDIVDGDNTGWFNDAPFQYFGEPNSIKSSELVKY
jgi:hypothetical protein